MGYVELPGSGEVKKVRRTRLKQLGASEPRRNGSVRFPNQIADAGVSAECGKQTRKTETEVGNSGNRKTKEHTLYGKRIPSRSSVNESPVLSRT